MITLVDAKLTKLVNKYLLLEQEIMDMISSLECYASDCHCDINAEEGTTSWRSSSAVEDINYCLKCGGFIV